jgi:hypothetical protein
VLKGSALLIRAAGPVARSRLLHRAPTVDAVVLVDRLHARGLTVRAWLVLHHDLRVPRASQVRTAAGDHLAHAPCPTAPEVHELDLALMEAIAGAAPWDGIDLEGIGWHGQAHADHHPKRGSSLDDLALQLSSLCFCDRCSMAFRGAVGPVGTLRRRLLRVASATAHRARTGPLEVLAPDIATEVEAILEHRRGVVRARLAELLAVIGGRLTGRVRVQASSSPAAAGAAAPFDSAWPDSLEGLIAGAESGTPEHVAREVGRLRVLAPGRSITATLLVPPAPQGRSTSRRTDRSRTAAQRVGADGIAWYHLGTAPASWTEALAAA